MVSTRSAPRRSAMVSLASVPVEILILIFTYLECFADLTSAAGVCKDWRNAMHLRLRASQHRQLPWLLQPSHDAPPSTITSYISGTTGRRICLPRGVRRRDRFCGSHEGGWVAVAADRTRPCYFVNLIKQAIAARVRLPTTLRRSHPTHSDMVEVRMVTLSDAPTARSCVAAAHTVGGYPSIIFCRPQVDRHWVPPLKDTELLQDTLYHRGEVYQGFYSISNRDNLYVFMPREINQGETLVMEQLGISFQPVPALDGGGAIMRYLVESRGKLLVVLRYSGRATGGLDLRTWHFKVLQLEINPMPDGEYSFALAALDGLDGRVITVGRGCSRAFEAGQYRGFQGGSIYFLDDAVGAGRMNSIFSFADFGMYSMDDETKIERPGLPTLYGPREMVYTTHNSVTHNVSLATEPVITSTLQAMVSEIVANDDDEATSSTSAGEEQVVHENVSGVWPLLCKAGNSSSPIWFLPPSADEWLLPPPPADDAV